MIDTKALRSKILDLAIRGLLTQQLPEDGTAEELYEQIQDEKEKLIQKGKLKKEKPLPEISEEEIPFEIPENWKWYRFGNIITLLSGQDLKKEEYNTKENGIPYLTGASNFDDKGRLLFNRWTTQPRVIAEKNDILLSCKGTVGKLTVLEAKRVHIARQFMAIKTYGLNSYFVNLFIQSIIEGIKKASKGLIPGIERNDILQLFLPLPPLSEQKRIVDIVQRTFSVLDTIDTLQAQYADNLEALKAKLIDLAIQGKLTDQLPEDGTAEELYRQIQEEKQKLIKEGKLKKEKPLPEITDDEIPFEIPENWKWVRLASICSIINGDRGKNYPAKSTLKHEGIPFISALNLNGVSVIQDENLLCLDDRQYELLSNGKLQKDDIVICIRGSLGKHGRYPFDKGAIASSLVISRLFYAQEIMGDYETIWLDSSAFPEEIKRYNSGTAQPNLAANSLEKFLIPLPPLAEQKRIVAKLDELLPLLEK